MKSKRNALLGALFCAAAERGISQEQLRDEIAPGLIGRRLSAASERQIADVLKHVAGPRRPRGTRDEGRKTRKYPSSLEGLRQEVMDLAKARFGEAWEIPLNAFCRRFGVARWQWLDVNHGKAVKQALVRMQNTETRGKGDAERKAGGYGGEEVQRSEQ